jgi:hypothetical protein
LNVFEVVKIKKYDFERMSMSEIVALARREAIEQLEEEKK